MKYVRKRIFALLAVLLSVVAASAQADKGTDRYLAKDAVPLVNGYVQFDRTVSAPGKSKAELYTALKKYVQTSLVEGAEHLPQARITEADSLDGVIAASMEEYLYFKRTKWAVHRVRFFYQLVCTVKDGEFSLMMRNLHYRYVAEEAPGAYDEDLRAEKMITDEEALAKNGTKLTRIGGKFRRFTIDRKDEIFQGAAKAAGVAKKYKTVLVEED